MLATIIDGEADLADVLYLIAVICFVIGVVFSIMRRSAEEAIWRAGFVALALAFLVL